MSDLDMFALYRYFLLIKIPRGKGGKGMECKTVSLKILLCVASEMETSAVL